MHSRTLQIVLLAALILAAAFLFTQTSVPLNQTSQLRRQHYIRQPEASVATHSTEHATEIERVDVGDDEQDAINSDDDSIVLAREADRVEVGVYIEALCPDSGRFILYDLADAHFPKDLWDIVDMKYYFWGNVRMSDEGVPICQHGAVECELNKLMQCALAELPPDSSPPGEPPAAQRMLECFFEPLMKHHGRADIMQQTAQKCIVGAGASYDSSKTCQEQGTHSAAVADAIEKTDSLDPKHTWVPWVTVAGQAINPTRLTDATKVTKEVCMAYDGDTRPMGCAMFPLPVTPDSGR